MNLSKNMPNVTFHTVLEEKMKENINHTRKCQKVNEALIFGTYLGFCEFSVPKSISNVSIFLNRSFYELSSEMPN